MKCGIPELEKKIRIRTNYEKGRSHEYRIKNKLEKDSWIVLRTAKSHGFADLIAINRDLKLIRFIQVKPRKFSQNVLERLKQQFKWLNDLFYVKFEVLGSKNDRRT